MACVGVGNMNMETSEVVAHGGQLVDIFLVSGDEKSARFIMSYE